MYFNLKYIRKCTERGKSTFQILKHFWGECKMYFILNILLTIYISLHKNIYFIFVVIFLYLEIYLKKYIYEFFMRKRIGTRVQAVCVNTVDSSSGQQCLRITYSSLRGVCELQKHREERVHERHTHTGGTNQRDQYE